MDGVVAGVTLAALVADGLLAGLSLDKVIVQLPARRRIGAVAYAAYARSADLGNGVAYYAVVGVGAAALTIAAFAAAAARGSSGAVTGLLAAAAALSVLHSIATGRAAPSAERSHRTALPLRPPPTWRHTSANRARTRRRQRSGSRG